MPLFLLFLSVSARRGTTRAHSPDGVGHGARRVCAALLCGLVIVGCGNGDDSGPMAVIEGVVAAGPVCPVETDPPDPSCAPRPVPSAKITAINEETGAERVAVTDAEGRFRIEIEAGMIRVTGAPVEGLMGVPDPIGLVAVGGGRHVVDLVYDTGIR